MSLTTSAVPFSHFLATACWKAYTSLEKLQVGITDAFDVRIKVKISGSQQAFLQHTIDKFIWKYVVILVYISV